MGAEDMMVSPREPVPLERKIEEDAQSIAGTGEEKEPIPQEPVEQKPAKPTVERMSWEEFLAAWESKNNPLKPLEKVTDVQFSKILGVSEGVLIKSKFIPAALYPVYWYLAPYLSDMSLIPEPFRPLFGAGVTLSMLIMMEKAKGGGKPK